MSTPSLRVTTGRWLWPNRITSTSSPANASTARCCVVPFFPSPCTIPSRTCSTVTIFFRPKRARIAAPSLLPATASKGAIASKSGTASRSVMSPRCRMRSTRARRSPRASASGSARPKRGKCVSLTTPIRVTRSAFPEPARALSAPSRRSVRGPAAVDRDRRAGDRDREVAAEERAERADLRRLDEALRGHRLEEGPLERLLLRDAAAVGLHELGCLILHEVGHDRAGADRVRGDVVRGALDCGRAGEADDAVLRGDVRRLVRRRDESV